MKGSLTRGGAAAVFLLGLLAAGCATPSARQERIRDAASWPSTARLRQSCVTALKSPGTWVPAAAAALVTVDDWDEKISRWAVRETPLFGSVRSARDASSDFRTAAHLAMIGTALAASGEDYTWEGKLQRLAVEQAGVFINSSITDMLKEAVNRERPDASNDASLPSSHASRAFNYATFASRNLETIDLGDGTRKGLRIGFYTLAATTAWARVEGEKHYPSDVLAGAALGHFMGLLLHDTFLGGREGTAVDVQMSRDGASLAFRIEY